MSGLQNEAPDCAGRNGAHTPGPWHLSVNGVDATDGAVIIDGNGNEVLGVSEWCRCEEADARLIAAAPELLDALKAMQPLWHHMIGLSSPPEWHRVNGLIESAIAKAEGRS